MINKNDNNFNTINIIKNKRANFVWNFKFSVLWAKEKLNISLIRKIVEIHIFILLFFMISKGNLHLFNRNSIDYHIFLEQKYEPISVAHNNSINFVKSCESKDLLHFQSLIDYNLTNPNISVVIPLYNCAPFILRAIKSVQLQNVTDFEIVLIDDLSTDNTFNIINNIQKEDNRIKILRNQKNMGTMYTRSIGVMMSRGKYLFNLDNDDLFVNNDIFHTITQINEKGNFDIVEFRAISNHKINRHILNSRIGNSIFTHPKPFILFQPVLGMYPIRTGKKPGTYGLFDIFLWGKCIKTQIYQKALNKLGSQRYSRFMIRYEDIVTNYMICNTAESLIYVEKYGIYHIVRSGSGTSVGKKKVSRSINLLYLIDIVIDFSLDYPNNKKLAAYLIIYYLKIPVIKKVLTRSRYRMNLFISCLRRIFNSTYISLYDKRKIRRLLKWHKYIRF